MRKLDIENKVFEVVKYKTSIRGYWKDEAGRLYIDNIKLFKAGYPLELDNKINDLFYKGEKAVFIRGKEKAFVIYPDNKQDVLKNNTVIIKPKGSLKPSFIKRLLKDYSGFTMLKGENFYLIDIWEA